MNERKFITKVGPGETDLVKYTITGAHGSSDGKIEIDDHRGEGLKLQFSRPEFMAFCFANMGLSREEIAQELNISPNTVRNHLASVVQKNPYFEPYRKLGTYVDDFKDYEIFNANALLGLNLIFEELAAASSEN